MDIRNIAIIAHVDHGKTTITDAIMHQTHTGADNATMDTNALEVERGITIYSKNTSVIYKDTKINIVDTPGHADFGSEVERVLRSVDSVVLLVDAQEGPMPQTRFVLSKSLELGHKPIVVLNKIDKPASRPKEAEDEILELFFDLGAGEEQVDFTTLYAIGKDGVAMKKIDDERKNIEPLLDTILSEVPVASGNTDAPLLVQPFNLAYDNFLGRLAIGRVYGGVLKKGANVIIKKYAGDPERIQKTAFESGVSEFERDREKNSEECRDISKDFSRDRSRTSESSGRNEVFEYARAGTSEKGKVTKLFTFEGTARKEVDEVSSGDIAMIAGLSNIYIGDTICDSEDTEALPAIKVDEPTIALYFLVNDSPFAGREGKFVTGRQIRERLEKELEVNVGLRVDFEGEQMKVFGRGELHIAILLENMRREGYEAQVSQPQVIVKEIDGVKSEPFEEVTLDIPETAQGTVIEKLSKRGVLVKNMEPKEGGRLRVVLEGPTRGLLGYRGEFVVDTKGEGIFSSQVIGFKSYAGDIRKRKSGSMASMAGGKALGFSLANLQTRGTLYIGAGTEVYEGMVVGDTAKGEDMQVNPTKGKQLTNMRSAGTDENVNLTPPIEVNIERGLEIMSDDEYLEITPKSVRLRKQFLTENERKKRGK